MPDGKHEAIHAIRKNLKRVRSLYRLVAEEIPRIQEEENTRLRQVAQSLSAIRDAAALIETAAHLKAEARNGEEKKVLGRIIEALKVRRDLMAEAEARIDRKLTEPPDHLKEAAAAVEDAHFNGGPRGMPAWSPKAGARQPSKPGRPSRSAGTASRRRPSIRCASAPRTTGPITPR